MIREPLRRHRWPFASTRVCVGFPETRTTFRRTRPGYRSVSEDLRFLLTDSVCSFGGIRDTE